MKQKDLKITIEKIDGNEKDFVWKIQNDPGLALRIMLALKMLLKFAHDYGFDSKTGKRKKLRWYHFLINKKLRKAAGAAIGVILDVFNNE